MHRATPFFLLTAAIVGCRSAPREEPRIVTFHALPIDASIQGPHLGSATRDASSLSLADAATTPCEPESELLLSLRLGDEGRTAVIELSRGGEPDEAHVTRAFDLGTGAPRPIPEVRDAAAPSVAARSIVDSLDAGSVRPSKMALSPDGRRLAIVRDDGSDTGGLAAKLETYDLATGRRLTRVPAALNEFANNPVWTDFGILLTACVCCGPGCAVFRVDPATGRSRNVGTNPALVIEPAHQLKGSTWVLVGSEWRTEPVDGGEPEPRNHWVATLVDLGTARKLKEVILPGAPDYSYSIAVAKHPSGDLVIAYGGAEPRIIRFNLQQSRIVSSVTPTAIDPSRRCP